MTDVTLPPLPNPAYGWYTDYYEGWCCIENPTDRWQELFLYSEEQMQAFAREAVLAERERCAKVCEARAADHEEAAEVENDERFDVYAKHERRCAIAIRAG